MDGLRGVAIIAVLLFHAYVSTPEFFPFGAKFQVIPLRMGWVGVNLFFLISGFVILMTLETCGSLFQFAIRRWLRLFPAMLAASVIIYTFDLVFAVGPAAKRSLIDFLPGLSFVSPALIHALTGIWTQSMDVPFWSLYVEVCFYVLFGCAYFFLGCNGAITFIFLLLLLTYVANWMASLGFGGSTFAKIAEAMNWIGFSEFGWFASGALFYRYDNERKIWVFVLALGAGIVAVLTTEIFRFGIAERSALAATLVLFVISLTSVKVQEMLRSKTLTFFGFISYPLYLVHNNILVGTLSIFDRSTVWMPDFFLPILPLCGVIALAYLIAVYVESALRDMLKFGHQKQSRADAA